MGLKVVKPSDSVESDNGVRNKGPTAKRTYFKKPEMENCSMIHSIQLNSTCRSLEHAVLKGEMTLVGLIAPMATAIARMEITATSRVVTMDRNNSEKS